jgi:selenide,water dikinase
VLLLTKPLGTGVISTALKQGRAPEQAIAAAIASMTRLNRDAAEALHEAEGGEQAAPEKGAPQKSIGPIHAVTDVTGFGLLGHAREMAAGSDVSFSIEHAKIELMAGAIEAARQGFLSQGLKNNRQFVDSCTRFDEGVPQEFRDLLYDPQTSGGLLISIAAEAAEVALAALHRRNVPGRAIGRVMAKDSALLQVK